MKDFQNKVAVITGAASGFGREFALQAQARGMKLVLADVQQQALQTFAEELRATGTEVVAQVCDVRHESQVQALADAAMQAFGVVHLLFNNAGVGSGGLIWENTASDWEWVLGVNLWGVIHGVRIFTPLMLAAGKADSSYQGHIVNTASMAGMLNAPTMGVYSVSKHAVVSLSETLYQDLQLIQAPVAASVLCPYFVPTGISQSHKNRPEDVRHEGKPTASQLVSQAMTEKAVSSSRVTAQEVAEKTFAAIAGQQFYIFSHPDALSGVSERAEEIVQGKNPGDPYAKTPHVGQKLREKMGIVPLAG